MSLYNTILQSSTRQLAILIDPDKFTLTQSFAKSYIHKIPNATTHLFIGGSTDPDRKIEGVVKLLRAETNLPLILFPGSYDQVTPLADALLFLSLLSGDNPEYLIGQQVKAAQIVKQSKLEVLPTAYLLIDGGSQTAVARVSNTVPLSQENVETIVNTALAGELLGKKFIYLEAGSGAIKPVNPKVIQSVCDAVSIPVIVGGGITTATQMERAYTAGASLVVIGTAFEKDSWKDQ